MKFNKLFFATMIITSAALTGCAELQNELSNIGKSAKDSAVQRAQIEASSKASETVGKALGSKY
ncbi:hypothetical protein [Avibacterium paragallinarum]|uniref:Lipoprotein n=1 Tax=Avibacterium paragallinarum TaxID=728 RepID=A0AAE5THW9_AVIPA|nr:hypothetical protein [Avibacterium paragallinarum]MEE3608561.1 hypothetical protein [Avibacterium paragallinarum]MEE3621206.1 hypothetical protein [Avibacterium paragallinarum]MEE3669178.1 hypothetical protein [Avibacterium paragallinarum]MEE3680254.1 hypothetical protein [Avibacterium paragallinarum]MEE4385353.1 hypothetical protein [Avibacterium paragallinarum]